MWWIGVGFVVTVLLSCLTLPPLLAIPAVLLPMALTTSEFDPILSEKVNRMYLAIFGILIACIILALGERAPW